MLVFKKMLLLLESVTWEEKLIGFHQMEPQQKDDSWPDVSEIGTVYRQMGATVPLSVQIHGSVLKECHILGAYHGKTLGLCVGLLGTKLTHTMGYATFALGFTHMYSSGPAAKVG